MRTIFYIVGCLLLLGCQKEDALESKIDYVNLYEIPRRILYSISGTSYIKTTMFQYILRIRSGNIF